jgi:predicted P-loop ATPase
LEEELRRKQAEKREPRSSSQFVDGGKLKGLSASGREELFQRLEAKQDEAAALIDQALGKETGASNKAVAPLAFQHSKNPAGIPASLENAITALEMLRLDCRYDVFHDKIIVRGCEAVMGGDALDNLENVSLKVRQQVLTQYKFDPGVQFTFDAIKLRCLDHVFDPVRDYFDGLRWDRKPRLDRWLIEYCGAEDTPLNRAIGRKMLIAPVRRVRKPGTKFDFMPVWESELQGIGKSSAIKIMAGEENYSDSEIIGLDKREQQEAVQGILLYEIAELQGMTRAEITSIKVFFSKTMDSARPAYARTRVDRPRRGIFIGTTNDSTYLRDKTGNRRFWPVKMWGVVRNSKNGRLEIDLAALERDRDQLWAEACEAEASGEPLIIPPELWGDAEVQQKLREEPDAWEDPIACELARLVRGGRNVEGRFTLGADKLGNEEWRVATDHLLTNTLDVPPERQNENQSKRLANVMRTLGWHRVDSAMWFGKVKKRGYAKLR